MCISRQRLHVYGLRVQSCQKYAMYNFTYQEYYRVGLCVFFSCFLLMCVRLCIHTYMVYKGQGWGIPCVCDNNMLWIFHNIKVWRVCASNTQSVNLLSLDLICQTHSMEGFFSRACPSLVRIFSLKILDFSVTSFSLNDKGCSPISSSTHPPPSTCSTHPCWSKLQYTNMRCK